MPSVTTKTPWARWYGLARWQRRAKLQLKTSHVCAECQRQGRVEIATIADHIEDHKGDQFAFSMVLFSRFVFVVISQSMVAACETSEETSAKMAGRSILIIRSIKRN
jgi:hypothetical protein